MQLGDLLGRQPKLAQRHTLLDDFTVAGVSSTISNAAVANGIVTLTLSATVTNGQSVTVAYTKHNTANRNIADDASQAVATFTAKTVTNNVRIFLTTGKKDKGPSMWFSWILENIIGTGR